MRREGVAQAVGAHLRQPDSERATEELPHVLARPGTRQTPGQPRRAHGRRGILLQRPRRFEVAEPAARGREATRDARCLEIAVAEPAEVIDEILGANGLRADAATRG